MRLLKKTLFFFAFAWAGSFHSLLAQASIITTIAGGGPISFLSEGGPATLSSLGGPDDIAFDSQGNLYIADPGYLLIRKVDMTTGIITTVAGDGTFNPGYSGDGGPATLASFNYPSGIAFDAQDNLFIADYENQVIRRVDKITGIITTVVGNGTPGYSGDGGPGLSAQLWSPIRIVFDPYGNLIIADHSNHAIRKWDPAANIITTLAGTGAPGFSGDGGPATLAALHDPEGISFDSAGNLYLTDGMNYVVRKVAAATGIITTIAGIPGVSGYSGDGGPATLAVFSTEPDAILQACNGNLYITDDFNNRIRMIDAATGIITTVAGNGTAGYSGDGGPPGSAQLSHPEALVLDRQGNLIFADYDYGVIRKITLVCYLTPTPTSTFTNSPTHSPTLTPTSTPTNSPTITPTFTPTNSPTVTPTKSPTPTPTNSPTITPSFTPTNTPTITPTFTPSHTATTTPTKTPTSTPTNSPTVTPTSTPTNSPTPTPSATPTNSPTETPTPTWDIQMGKQVSKTSRDSGDLLTYTLGVTVLGNLVNGVVVTDALPPEITFTGFGTVGSGSATFSSSATLIQWTLTSPLPPGIYQLTYNAQVNPFVAGGVEIVNGAQLTASGLSAPLTSSVTVKVSGNYTVRVGLYNEAGELIRQLFVKQFSQPVNSITLKGGAITRLSGAGDHIDIYHDEFLLGSWDGKDAQGHPVSNGVYHIKMDNVDAFGAVTTVTQQAVVSRSLAKVSVNVYNEAGEVVKHLYSLVDDSNGTQMTNILLSGKAIQPGSQGSQSDLKIEVQTSGIPVTLSWDGTSDSGALVTNGQYLLAVRWADGQGGTTEITRTVLVTAGQIPNGGTITAQPNILKIAAGQTSVSFKSTSSPSLTLRARIYTMAGELIGVFEGRPQANEVDWDASSLASGMVLAVVEEINANGGVKNRKTLKILVIR